MSKARPGTIPILTYHSLDASGSVVSVQPEWFESQMAALDAMGYRAVCLREAVGQREATNQWPRRTVVLTFDDGYDNLHRHALPTLARHGFGATVFLVTGHLGKHNDWESPPPGLGRQPMLNWQQIEEMFREGWEIGAHTRSHPNLTELSTDDAEAEMRDARTDIETRLGVPVESFAYPYGYTNEAVTAIADRVFRASCVTELRCAGDEPLHSLPRIDAYYLNKPGQIERLVQGRLRRYVSIRRWGRRLRALVSD